MSGLSASCRPASSRVALLRYRVEKHLRAASGLVGSQSWMVESPELEARSPLGRHARAIMSLATSPCAARASLTGSRRWQGENVWEGSLAGDLAGWKTRVLRLGLWGESRLRIFWPPFGPMAALPLLIHRCGCDAPTAQPAPPGAVPSARTRACNSQLGSATNLPSVQ